MSFKHVKFEDSPIMRSLEKVAREKGLVKPEPPLQKTAALSKKANLTPTPNLMENIFKLCAGLREQGRVVEASEVETNYLNYKRAQTLYEAHKETGDDLIHSAHPKGSHKLEGVAGDEATFEDILDKHTKILQMVEKKPTGKLSSAAQILGAVKKSLGQQANESASLVAQIRAQLSKVSRIFQGIDNITRDELSAPISQEGYVDKVQKLSQNPTIDNIEDIRDLIDKLSSRLDPTSIGHYLSLGLAGLSKDTWSKVKPNLDAAKEAINAAHDLRARYNEITVPNYGQGPQADSRAPATEPEAAGPDTLSQQFSALASKIDLYKAQAESSAGPNSAAIVAWLDKAAGFVTQYSKAYADNKFKSDPKITQNFATKLKDIQTKVEALAQKYIK